MPKTLPDLTEKDIAALSKISNQEEAEKHFKGSSPNPSSKDWMWRISAVQKLKLAESDPQNGEEIEVSPDTIEEIFNDSEGLIFQLERGEKTGYRHFQGFVTFPSARRFSSLRKRFTSRGLTLMFCRPRWSSVKSCLAYCSKPQTREKGPWQVGEFQTEATKKLGFDSCVELLDQGKTIQDLLTTPETKTIASQKLPALKAIESAKLFQLSQQERDVEAFFLWGPPRTGKTFSVTHLRHAPEDCFLFDPRDKNPWDAYQGESCLVIDEFESQPDFHSLCSWLEPYPTKLPCRFSPKWALWSEVWIISNDPLETAVSRYSQRVPASMLPSLPGRIKAEIHRTLEGETVSTPPEFAKLQEGIEAIKAIPLAKL